MFSPLVNTRCFFESFDQCRTANLFTLLDIGCLSPSAGGVGLEHGQWDIIAEEPCRRIGHEEVGAAGMVAAETGVVSVGGPECHFEVYTAAGANVAVYLYAFGNLQISPGDAGGGIDFIAHQALFQVGQNEHMRTEAVATGLAVAGISLDPAGGKCPHGRMVIV